MTAIALRPLQRSEWAAFREIRLFALRAAPGVFSASYEGSAAKGRDDWEKMIEGPGRQAFGLFDGDRLVGITGVLTSSEDPSGGTALLVMSFILPEYRGRGLSRLFYDARLEWVRARSGFVRIIVSHRESNEASRKANQRCGFRPTGRASKTWPDGCTEDEVFYEMDVSR